jgi:hypothetical protein
VDVDVCHQHKKSNSPSCWSSERVGMRREEKMGVTLGEDG